MYKPRYIKRLLLLLMLAVSAMGGAMAQTTYQGKIDTLSVVDVPGTTYTWELYTTPTPNFATTPGNVTTEAVFLGPNTGASVRVQWLVPGTYYYKVTALGPTGCMNLKIGRMEVLPAMPVVTIDPDTICAGDTAYITVGFVSTGPWNFTLTDGTNTWNYTTSTNPMVIPVTPAVTTSYWITQVTYISFGFTYAEPTTPIQVLVHPLPVTSPIYKY